MPVSLSPKEWRGGVVLEVGYRGLASLAEEDVSGLDVPVNDSVLVSIVQSSWSPTSILVNRSRVTVVVDGVTIKTSQLARSVVLLLDFPPLDCEEQVRALEIVLFNVCRESFGHSLRQKHDTHTAGRLCLLNHGVGSAIGEL